MCLLSPSSSASAAATTSISTGSRSRAAARWRPETACWSPPRPGRARPSWGSSPSTWPWRRASSASTPRRSRPCPTRSSPTWSARHGAANVGLLTGDNTVNGEAPIVVMTTEVLRNMLYAGSGDAVRARLRGDGRGPLPRRPLPRRGLGRGHHPPAGVGAPGVAVGDGVATSRSSASWLAPCAATRSRSSGSTGRSRCGSTCWSGRRMFDLFANGADGEAMPGANGQGGISASRELRVNPELVRLTARRVHATTARPARPRSRPRRARPVRRRGRWIAPSRVGRHRDSSTREGLLPAITFIFSRAGCDAAVQQFLHAGVRLLNADERARVQDARRWSARGRIPSEDLNVLGYHDWFDGLQRGVAAHHAGMLPTFKEIVEELFVRAWSRRCSRPRRWRWASTCRRARVVMEALVKWNGENHADLTAGEYTQLTGRAGRRGIDIEGHAVVLWRPDLDAKALAGLAGTRTYPLRSSFKPSYNMAVNLVGQFGAERARNLLETSFAQYQADQAVVGPDPPGAQERQGAGGLLRGHNVPPRRLRRVHGAAPPALRPRGRPVPPGCCEPRARPRWNRWRSSSPATSSWCPAGKRAGVAVVLDPGIPAATAGRPKQPTGDGPRPMVLTVDRQVVRLSLTDFPSPAEPLDHMRVPKSFNAKSPQSPQGPGRRRCAARRATRRSRRTARPATAPRRRTTRRSAACARRSARTPATAARTARTTPAGPSATTGWTATPSSSKGASRAAPTASPASSTASAACWSSWATSTATRSPPIGKRLGRLYTELDLLTAETLRAGLWEGLTPPELAACVSALVYEARRADDAGPPRLPGGAVPKTLTRWSASGRSWRNWRPTTTWSSSANPTSASPSPPTTGRRARHWRRSCGTWRCRRATSSAGASS